jgi:hypothetical protein
VTNWLEELDEAPALVNARTLEYSVDVVLKKALRQKLRVKGFVERLGTSRRYRLTPLGLKLGVLLVKLRNRLLGPLATISTAPHARRTPTSLNSVDIAFHQLDVALDHLSAALGLKLAA